MRFLQITLATIAWSAVIAFVASALFRHPELTVPSMGVGAVCALAWALIKSLQEGPDDEAVDVPEWFKDAPRSPVFIYHDDEDDEAEWWQQPTGTIIDGHLRTDFPDDLIEDELPYVPPSPKPWLIVREGDA